MISDILNRKIMKTYRKKEKKNYKNIATAVVLNKERTKI